MKTQNTSWHLDRTPPFPNRRSQDPAKKNATQPRRERQREATHATRNRRSRLQRQAATSRSPTCCASACSKALLSALLCSLLPSQNRAAQQHAPSAVGWWDLSYVFYNNALELTAASGPEKRGWEFNCLSPVCSASVCDVARAPWMQKWRGGGARRDEACSLQQAQQQLRTDQRAYFVCVCGWFRCVV